MKRKQIASPELVAEVIYKAAIDPSRQLRYHTGSDLMIEREELNDNDFIGKMAQRFGIDIE